MKYVLTSTLTVDYNIGETEMASVSVDTSLVTSAHIIIALIYIWNGEKKIIGLTTKFVKKMFEGCYK